MTFDYQSRFNDASIRKDKIPANANMYEGRTEPLCKCQVVIMMSSLQCCSYIGSSLPDILRLAFATACTVVSVPPWCLASQGIVDGQTKETKNIVVRALHHLSTMLRREQMRPFHMSR